MTALFINRTDLVKNTIINGSVDLDLFIQFIKIAQEQHIQNYLGTKLYDKIAKDILDDDVDADTKSYLINIYNLC